MSDNEDWQISNKVSRSFLNKFAPPKSLHPEQSEDVELNIFPTLQGHLLRHYRIQKKLGCGAMGEVYQALDTQNNHSVAIKRLCLVKESHRRRFYREYKFLQSVTHPNLIKAYAHFEDNGQMFLVLEYVPGISLKQFIVKRNTTLTLFEQLTIADKVARGLEALHKAGIVHRDIKPANIMVDEKTGMVKILDLGLAKSLAYESMPLTGRDSILGTAAYLSPEQIAGNEIDTRSDIFSLGTTLYQLFACGENSPFYQWGENAYQVLHKIASCNPPPLHETEWQGVSSKICYEISDIIAMAMEKAPEKRLQAGEIAKRLAIVRKKLRRSGERFIKKQQESKVNTRFNQKKTGVEGHKASNFSEIKVNETQKTSPAFFKWLAAITVFFLATCCAAIIVWTEFQQPKKQKHLPAAKAKDKEHNQKDIEKDKKIKEPNDDGQELREKDGHELREKDGHERVIENLDKAIELDPNMTKAYYNHGMLYGSKKNYSKAIKNLDKAIELDPNMTKAYYNRGMFYGHMENYDRAIENLDKAIELVPNIAKAYYNRGICYGSKSDYSKAIEDFSKAIELDSNMVMAYYYRGSGYQKKSDYSKAIEDLDKAIELSPNMATAYYDRGIVYGHLKNYSKAMEDLSKAIELDPNMANAYYNRGTIYGRLKNYSKAIEDLSKAIELDPNMAKAYHNRGAIYGHLKNYSKAIEDLSKAIELDPNVAKAYHNRGMFYELMGNLDKAIANYRQAYKLGWEPAKKALRQLKVLISPGDRENNK